MALAKRLYVVKRGEDYAQGRTLKAAFAALSKAVDDDCKGEAPIVEGDHFSYRVYEGGNSVECVVVRERGGTIVRYKERGK